MKNINMVKWQIWWVTSINTSLLTLLTHKLLALPLIATFYKVFKMLKITFAKMVSVFLQDQQICGYIAKFIEHTKFSIHSRLASQGILCELLGHGVMVGGGCKQGRAWVYMQILNVQGGRLSSKMKCLMQVTTETWGYITIP